MTYSQHKSTIFFGTIDFFCQKKVDKFGTEAAAIPVPILGLSDSLKLAHISDITCPPSNCGCTLFETYLLVVYYYLLDEDNQRMIY